MNTLDLLREQFNGHVALREKRPAVQQLFAPLFHEDGDMMDIFLDLPRSGELTPDQPVRISDYGLTRMRLSYSFDIDTENKEQIFSRILAENGVADDNGALVLDTTAASLYPALLQFAQAVGKVSNLRLFRREVLASFFDEMLAEFIRRVLARFRPVPSVFPVPEHDEYEVDWQFQANGVPTYLFTVKDASKARLAALSCREFQHRELHFHSMVVHEHFERLGRKEHARLTNACDKQFTSLDEFKENVLGFFARQLPEPDARSAVALPAPGPQKSVPTTRRIRVEDRPDLDPSSLEPPVSRIRRRSPEYTPELDPDIEPLPPPTRRIRVEDRPDLDPPPDPNDPNSPRQE